MTFQKISFKKEVFLFIFAFFIIFSVVSPNKVEAGHNVYNMLASKQNDGSLDKWLMDKNNAGDIKKALQSQDLHELSSINALLTSNQKLELQAAVGGKENMANILGTSHSDYSPEDGTTPGTTDPGTFGTPEQRLNAFNGSGTQNGNGTDSQGGGDSSGAGAGAGGASGGAEELTSQAGGVASEAALTAFTKALQFIFFSFGGRVTLIPVPCILVFPPAIPALATTIIDFVGVPHPQILFYATGLTRTFTVGPPVAIGQQILGTAVTMPTICFTTTFPPVPIKGNVMIQMGSSPPGLSAGSAAGASDLGSFETETMPII